MQKHKNIFLMPCGASVTYKHLQQTVLNRVSQETIFPVVTAETRDQLQAVFGSKDIAVWGSVIGRGNLIYFNKMQPGDVILFTVRDQVQAVGQIAVKTTCPELSAILWPNDEGRYFSLIYFIDKVTTVTTSLAKVFAAFGYKDSYLLQGLTAVSAERLQAFYKNHTDVLSLVTGSKKRA